jgi:hypothetical protein
MSNMGHRPRAPFGLARCPFSPLFRPHSAGGAARGSQPYDGPIFVLRASQLLYSIRIGHTDWGLAWIGPLGGPIYGRQSLPRTTPAGACAPPGGGATRGGGGVRAPCTVRRDSDHTKRAPSAGRGKGRPTGPFTTTGIPCSVLVLLRASSVLRAGAGCGGGCRCGANDGRWPLPRRIEGGG